MPFISFSFKIIFKTVVNFLGFMYIWSENIASRGGQEIGSCLLKHFENHIPEEAKHIILYSDSCGGQNRNIKMVMFLKKFLGMSGKRIIEQKFFVSGHSYNSCDRCFSLIEKRKKFVENVYTPNGWINLIQDSKKSEPKFHITVMLPEDFLSSDVLEKLIVNRKKNLQKLPINWFEFRVIRYLKEQPFQIIAETATETHTINIQRKGVDECMFNAAVMNCLYPDGKLINLKKFSDLMHLIKYIPKKYHSFYLNLKYGGDELDFGLASDDDCIEPNYDDDDDDIFIYE